MFSTLSPSPFTPPVRPPTGQGENGLPNREDILALWKNVGGVLTESIGLSVSDYPLVPAVHRSIYFVDETTMRAVEDIVNKIEASAELNDGGELVGSEAKGYVQYADGTTEDILRKAYRYFGITYPESFGPTWVEPGTWNDNLIWSE